MSSSTRKLLDFLRIAAAHAGPEVDSPTFEVRGVGISYWHNGRKFCRFDPKHQQGHVAVMVPGGNRPQLNEHGKLREREDGPWVFIGDLSAAVRLIPEILDSYERLRKGSNR